jgi:hypothetical protein
LPERTNAKDSACAGLTPDSPSAASRSIVAWSGNSLTTTDCASKNVAVSKHPMRRVRRCRGYSTASCSRVRSASRHRRPEHDDWRSSESQSKSATQVPSRRCFKLPCRNNRQAAASSSRLSQSLRATECVAQYHELCRNFPRSEISNLRLRFRQTKCASFLKKSPPMHKPTAVMRNEVSAPESIRKCESDRAVLR